MTNGLLISIRIRRRWAIKATWPIQWVLAALVAVKLISMRYAVALAKALIVRAGIFEARTGDGQWQRVRVWSEERTMSE